MTTTPFTGVHKTIAVFHAVLVLLFVVAGLASAGGAEGWADLARVAVLALAGAYMVALVVAVAATYWLMRRPVPRALVLLAAPPLAVLVTVVVLRAGS